MLSDLIASDFDFFEGREDITLVTRRTEDGAAVENEYPIGEAIPGEVTHREQSLSTLIPEGAVTRGWSVRKRDLDDFDITPREGDLVKDGEGTEWTIRAIHLRSQGVRYRLICSKGRE